MCSPGDHRLRVAPASSYGPNALDLIEASWSSMESAASISPGGMARPLAGVRGGEHTSGYSSPGTEPSSSTPPTTTAEVGQRTMERAQGPNLQQQQQPGRLFLRRTSRPILSSRCSSMESAASISPGGMARPLAGVRGGEHTSGYSSPGTEPSSSTPPTTTAEVDQRTMEGAQGPNLQQQQQPGRLFLRRTSRSILSSRCSNMDPASSISSGGMARPLAGVRGGEHTSGYSSPGTEPSSSTPPTTTAEVGQRTMEGAQGPNLQQQHQPGRLFLRRTSRSILSSRCSNMDPASSISSGGMARPLAGVRGGEHTSGYSSPGTEPSSSTPPTTTAEVGQRTMEGAQGPNLQQQHQPGRLFLRRTSRSILSSRCSNMDPASSISSGGMARPLAGVRGGEHTSDYSSPGTAPSSSTSPTTSARGSQRTMEGARGPNLQQQQQQPRRLLRGKTSRSVLSSRCNKSSVPEGEQGPGLHRETFRCPASSANGTRRRRGYEAATIATAARSLASSSGAGGIIASTSGSRPRDISPSSMKQAPTQSLSLPTMRRNLARAARASKVGTKADPVTLYWQRHEEEKRNKSCRLASCAKDEKARFEVGGVRASVPSIVVPWR